MFLLGKTRYALDSVTPFWVRWCLVPPQSRLWSRIHFRYALNKRMRSPTNNGLQATIYRTTCPYKPLRWSKNRLARSWQRPDTKIEIQSTSPLIEFYLHEQHHYSSVIYSTYLTQIGPFLRCSEGFNCSWSRVLCANADVTILGVRPFLPPAWLADDWVPDLVLTKETTTCDPDDPAKALGHINKTLLPNERNADLK